MPPPRASKIDTFPPGVLCRSPWLVLAPLWLPFGSIFVVLVHFWLRFRPFWLHFLVKILVLWVPEFATHLRIAVRTSIKGNLPCRHASPTWPGAGTCRRQFAKWSNHDISLIVLAQKLQFIMPPAARKSCFFVVSGCKTQKTVFVYPS